MKRILVIGSLNMDLVTHVPTLPQVGETIACTKFQENPGGKGANQAVAAAKLGADVAMIGKVGVDEYGETLITSLKQAGVSTEGVSREDNTGMAFINVSEAGDNHIVLVAGANKAMRCSDIDKMKSLIDASDLIIMQLEIPLEVVEYALNHAVKQNIKVILNPAPAQQLSREILRNVYALIPNETELQIITGMPVSKTQEVIAAAQYLKTCGVNKVIVTMGSHGSILINDNETIHIPALQVKAVDTTAAGDSYVAAFAVGKAKGMDDQEAAQLANKIAAITVTREGAQRSLPTMKELETFLLNKLI